MSTFSMMMSSAPFRQVMDVYDIKAVFFNEDQVGIGQRRDKQVTDFLGKEGHSCV